jgi:hypothetical protein
MTLGPLKFGSDGGAGGQNIDPSLHFTFPLPSLQAVFYHEHTTPTPEFALPQYHDI